MADQTRLQKVLLHNFDTAWKTVNAYENLIRDEMASVERRRARLSESQIILDNIVAELRATGYDKPLVPTP